MDPRNPYQDIHQSGMPQAPVEQASVQPSRKPVYVILGIIAVLLAVLVVLVAMLVFTRRPTVQVVSSQGTAQSSDGRIVAGRMQLSNPNLELVVYAPKQTASNTTVNFAIRNKCSDCTDSIYASAYDLLGYSRANPSAVYLIDQDAGQKYEPITDEAKKVLGSESCSDYLKSGQSVDCFISFTKVSAGSTVSAVLGSRAPKVDGITVD